MIENKRHTVYTIFRNKIDEFQQKTAIKYGDDSLTYSQLGTRVDYLADCMQIDDEEIVATWLDPSFDLIVATLSIFKLNGVYMPVNVNAGSNRITDAFKLTNCKTIITSHNKLSECLKYLNDLNISVDCIYIIKDHDHISKCNLLDELVKLKPKKQSTDKGHSDKSYIFHTSGSTGEAKAIMGSHKSLLHFINWEIETFDIGPDCKVSLLSNITFDASLRDIFIPLCTGGTLCIPENNIKNNLGALVKWIDVNKLTLIHCVPSVYRLMIKELEDKDAERYSFNDLKHILMAGEILYAKDVKRGKKYFENTTLVNLYGTSETTLAKTYHIIDDIPEVDSQVIHVGQPIDNTFIAIINNGKLCKVGEIGEIYIKTTALTYGYYNRPELTNSVFVQNPLVDEKDVIYKTGDLGRYLSGRDIEVLGRTDSQVKVNGIRVELEEIEKVILTFKEINEAIIIPFNNGDEQTMLAAYYTGLIEEDKVKTALTGKISDSLLPAVVKRLEEFPLNVNGKIDKKALPNPAQLIVQSDSAYEQPVTDTEYKLELIWREVLGLKRISRTSSFFDVGGTSLRCLQVISKVFKVFQVLIKVSEFFDKPTIAALAEHLDGVKSKDFKEIPISPFQTHYDLSHAQKRIWILDQLMEESRAYNVANVFSIKGDLKIEAFGKSIFSLIERHESLRTNFKLVEGEPKQMVQSIGDSRFMFDYINITDEDNQEELLRKHINSESMFSFDLSKDSLIKAKLIQTEASGYIFILTLHHIITDGWSMEVLTDDLFEFYNYHTENTTTIPKPLTIQYKDYAEWHNKGLGKEDLQKYRDYWVDNMHDYPKDEILKPDFERAEIMKPLAKTQSFSIKKSVRERLNSICKLNDVSPFMFFSALWTVVLHKHSKKEDVVFGCPVAGRNHPQLENQVGLYMNMMLLRTKLNSQDGFINFLQSVKKKVTQSLDNSNYPFDNLIKDLEETPARNRNPLFDIGFTYINELEMSHTRSDSKFNELDVAYLSNDFELIKADLWLKVLDLSDDMMIDLTYNMSLFKEITIQKLLVDMEFLLKVILDKPESTIEELCSKVEKNSENTNQVNKKVLKEKNLSLLRELSV